MCSDCGSDRKMCARVVLDSRCYFCVYLYFSCLFVCLFASRTRALQDRSSLSFHFFLEYELIGSCSNLVELVQAPRAAHIFRAKIGSSSWFVGVRRDLVCDGVVLQLCCGGVPIAGTVFKGTLFANVVVVGCVLATVDSDNRTICRRYMCRRGADGCG